MNMDKDEENKTRNYQLVSMRSSLSLPFLMDTELFAHRKWVGMQGESLENDDSNGRQTRT